jgi:hypothetical protein
MTTFIELQADLVALAIDSHMQNICKFMDWQYFTIGNESVYCLDLIDPEMCEPSPMDTDISNYREFLADLGLKASDENWEVFYKDLLLTYAKAVKDEWQGKKILARLF